MNSGTRSRRTVSALTLSIALPAVALATAASGTLPAHPPGGDPPSAGTPEQATIRLSEGTNFAAAAAPDGSTIIDLHNMLYRVPATGGPATRLTDPILEAARPDVGPDGRIAFQAYRDGRFHIWTSDADGSDPTQLTFGGFDDREPRWSPDGEHIVFSSDRRGSYDIWSVQVDTGRLTRWTEDPGQEFHPSWSPTGEQVVHVAGNSIRATARGGASEVLVPAPTGTATLHAPAMAPDGERVAYVRHDGTQADLMVDDEQATDGQDVFLFTPEWIGEETLLYTADGGIRTRSLSDGRTTEVPFRATVRLPAAEYDLKEHDFDDRRRRSVDGVLTPQLSPDGSRVLFVALNDLWLMPIDGRPRRLTDDDYHEVNPVFSPDGRRVAYSSDRAGTEDIYVRDLRTGRERRVTAIEGAEVSAAFSPDGTRLAFQDQVGATYVLDLASGEVRELVPSLFGPGRPTWSADGSTIAFAAVRQYSQRFREGTSQILTVDVETGEQQFHAPGGEHASLSTRGDDGPVWSPNGRSMAFIVGSRVKVMPVAADGTPTGRPRTLNNDVADAPSWSGDSRKILYLSQGELRLADVRTGRARTIDVPLHYRPDVARGVKVIHAGAFWDGEARQLRRNVDILVVGNRIRSITPHRWYHPRNARGIEFIDASDLTIMPGLMDAHVHQEYESRFFGDRQGRINLAYGVTSTLSVGDQVYRALEDRDSLEAGERVGPRFYATGEPIDGSRVYYNFMRPTRTDAEVERELTRARKLDYDFLKTYVRLPADRMARVVEEAHRLGLRSSSHYLSPGALIGQDGTTHLAATQRLGYARTITATGHSYADVPAMYGAGNRTVTTTLFTTDFLSADEIASDPRLALLPSWKREALVAQTSDNLADPQDPECETAMCQEVRTFQRIDRAGGLVLVGTDAPLDQVGIGVHGNLQELVGYGWSPYDALRAAIVNPARYLGVADDVGTLEKGKVADLIGVRGNPLEDIDAAARVELAMVGGRAHTVEELMRPFADPAGTSSAAEPETQEAQEAQEAQERGTQTGPAPATRVTARVDRSVTGKYWWHDPAIIAEQYAHACDAYEALAHQAEWGRKEGHAGSAHHH